jgi:hypothetical protein
MYSYTQQSAVLRAACELLHRKTKWKRGRKNSGTYISNSEEEKPRSKKREREREKEKLCYSKLKVGSSFHVMGAVSLER